MEEATLLSHDSNSSKGGVSGESHLPSLAEKFTIRMQNAVPALKDMVARSHFAKHQEFLLGLLQILALQRCNDSSMHF